MDTQLSIDLGQIAHELHLPHDRVQRTVELLDDGNTVPFITRYRREQTGGLDEEQIRHIDDAVKRRRQLLERKQTILKTIESQGKLTPELQHEIEQAHNLKRLEDLYLPFKPKKQTLATVAREQGLEPLTLEILNADIGDFESRLTELVNPEKGLHTSTDVLEGIQHIAAEKISERADLRGRLRRIFFRSGLLICSKIEKPPEAVAEEQGSAGATEQASAGAGEQASGGEGAPATDSESAPEQPVQSVAPEQASVGAPEQASEAAAVEEIPTEEPVAAEAPAESPVSSDDASPSVADQVSAASPEAGSETPTTTLPVESTGAELPQGRLFEKPAQPAMAPLADKKKKKKKKKKLSESAFKDYFNFREPLTKLPPHRTLAINRGERANVLRVKIEADVDAMLREAEEVAVPPQHPHKEFLRQCVRDALTRLIIPSLEREARRELSEKAEGHAVEVFVRNLRKLLLQPPVHGRRVLAIDPGFKSGCKVAALDEWGNVLAHGMFYVVGRDDRRDKARQRIAEMVRQHQLSVIAIGNGTAGRETEQLVADILATELKDLDVAYVTVNEAGASVYSTSPLGREELPTHDAILRSAVSIGRRLLDPLSELVKINPANIGVGLYQHDMKAKHLKDSLDAVVESAVNFVGVDVNSASPALLRYVSGLNALTARRIYEHRRENGPFKNREELKSVPGVGDQTFVQAAGFLKILGGDNPLDATWIHPESYDLAKRVLERFGSSVEELAQAVPTPVTPPKKEAPKFAEGLVGLVHVKHEGDAGAPEQASAGAGEQEVPGASETPADELPAPPAATSEDEPLEQAADGAIQTSEAILTAALNETPTDDSIALHMPESPPDEVSPEHLQANVAGEVVEGAPSSAAEAAPELPAASKPNPIAEKLANVDVRAASGDLQASPLLLEDIVTSLMRPGRDPREELPPPVFRRGIMKLEDLQKDMELQGTVLNVVDFGAFVDIGLTDSGLVHISRLADRFIRDPHEVVGVGDVLKLWVVEIDKGRRRVSLTAIPPGSVRPPRPKREERPQRPPRPQQPQQQRPQQERSQQPRPQRSAGGPNSGRPQQGPPPPRQRPPSRRPQGGPPRRDEGPRVIERPATKPKVVKPLTKAQEEGKKPLRSFSDLMQLMEKKKDKKPPAAEGNEPTEQNDQ
jgi:uncharacterized protein